MSDSTTTWARGASDITHVMDARITKTGDAGVFEAVISTYDIDRSNERVAPGALTESILKMRAQGRNLPVLGEAHAWNEPTAICGWVKADQIRETPRGIEVTGQIDTDSPMGAATWAAMKARTLNEWSIGMADVERHIDGQGVSVIDKATLIEVSACFMGVNPNTRTTALKTADLDALIASNAEDRGTLCWLSGVALVRGESVYTTKHYDRWGTDLILAAGKALREYDAGRAPAAVRESSVAADAMLTLTRAAAEYGATEAMLHEGMRKAAATSDARRGAVVDKVCEDWKAVAGVMEKARSVAEWHGNRAVQPAREEREAPGSRQIRIGPNFNVIPGWRTAEEDRKAEADLIETKRTEREARERQEAARRDAEAARTEAGRDVPRPGWNV